MVGDPFTGQVCCHLCGRLFTLLGAHVRVHGLDAAGYRELVGLCRTRALAAPQLSSRIQTRQRMQYDAVPAVRDRLALGQELARSGQLAWRRSRRDQQEPEPPERRRGRLRELAAGRARRQLELADQRVGDRLLQRGSQDVHAYLRQAYADGASLEALAAQTGLGRDRLRQALRGAGVTSRPSGVNTAAGRRSRARTADQRAAAHLGVPDLRDWLRARRDEGRTLTRLAEPVGHSTHWVRWRLEEVASESA